MMLRYKSDYPNQVHQLMVSVSKHIYVTKSGRLKHQKKSLDVNLQNVSRSDKEHVVHYLIRDHFSGTFYGEVCSSLKLMPIEEFLNRAWSKKEEYIFCGLPEYLSIPKTVSETFPTVHNFIQQFGIETLEVTSGFQGGIRDVPTWESYLQMVIAMKESITIADIQMRADRICNYINGGWSDRESKVRKWGDNIGEIKTPSGEVLVIARD